MVRTRVRPERTLVDAAPLPDGDKLWDPALSDD